MKLIYLILLATASFLHAESLDGIQKKSDIEVELQEPLQGLAPEEFATTSLPSESTCYKNPSLAAGLSILFPGLGDLYLGDTYKALGFMTASVGGIVASALAPDPISVPSALLSQNIGFYSVYSVYRDGRICSSDTGYCYPMPKESLKELLLAPFQPSVLKKPEVWGGILGSLTVAIGTVCLSEANARLDITDNTIPLLALPIGVGEEAFFRGYLQSELTELSGPLGGIVFSSLIFGAAHIPNAYLMDPHYRSKYFTYSIPLITGIGAYLGWLTYKNTSLKESVAVHAWYDFILMTTAALANYSASKEANFAFSFSF